MPSRMNATFLLLVGLQALHSVEEYAAHFYERFPPARALGHVFPGVPRPGFVGLNVALFVFGVWCYFARVRHRTASAAMWAWVWVAIEMFNGVAHPVWAVSVGGYAPGLITAPLLLVVALTLAWQLRRASSGGTPRFCN